MLEHPIASVSRSATGGSNGSSEVCSGCYFRCASRQRSPLPPYVPRGDSAGAIYADDKVGPSGIAR